MKRPVIKFLQNVDISELEKNKQLEIGLRTLETVREITIKQKDVFEELASRTQDLPIKLTAVRMLDILCWTTEKWDLRKNLNAPYGTPHKSLLHSLKQVEPTKPISPHRQISSSKIGKQGRFVVFEDLDKATGPKVHVASCALYQRWLKNQTKTTTWHGPFTSLGKAWNKCKKIACRQGLHPSKHSCVTS